jgi:glucoamylase
VPPLEDWVATEARIAATGLLRAISATNRVTERPGFGQTITARPGSVLASPVPAHYDPDPDYFFHWFRDAAIVIDALRVAFAAGDADRSAVVRLQEFLQFNLDLSSLDGRDFLRHSDFRAKVQPAFLQYVRPDAEIAALTGGAILGDVRVNADGTLDFTRWSRPQSDGPALNALALLRWWQQFPELRQATALETAMRKVLSDALAYTLSQVSMPCGDVWEEQSGYHYFTLLVQAQALIRGADWLEEMGQTGSVQAYRVAADETLSWLDSFWNGPGGYYRSQAPSESEHPRRVFDISAVVGVLHAGRASGRHSVLDSRSQATLTALEELFEREFVINHERPPDRGPALGRYAGDSYYGGGAWYLATLGAAEFYFRLAQALREGSEMPETAENLRFRQRLGMTEGATGAAALALLAIERGDSFLRTVRAYTPGNGELSEQFDRNSGIQTSAKHLSWSYAAFITAAASRAEACRTR